MTIFSASSLYLYYTIVFYTPIRTYTPSYCAPSPNHQVRIHLCYVRIDFSCPVLKVGRLLYEYMQTFHVDGSKKCYSLEPREYFFYCMLLCVHMYRPICTCMYVCAHVCMPSVLCGHVCCLMYVCTYVRMCTCVHA